MQLYEDWITLFSADSNSKNNSLIGLTRLNLVFEDGIISLSIQYP